MSPLTHRCTHSLVLLLLHLHTEYTAIEKQSKYTYRAWLLTWKHKKGAHVIFWCANTQSLSPTAYKQTEAFVEENNYRCSILCYSPINTQCYVACCRAHFGSACNTSLLLRLLHLIISFLLYIFLCFWCFFFPFLINIMDFFLVYAYSKYFIYLISW